MKKKNRELFRNVVFLLLLVFAVVFFMPWGEKEDRDFERVKIKERRRVHSLRTNMRENTMNLKNMALELTSFKAYVERVEKDTKDEEKLAYYKQVKSWVDETLIDIEALKVSLEKLLLEAREKFEVLEKER